MSDMQIPLSRLLAFTAAVLVLALLVYWPGLSGPFALDDAQNVVKATVAEPSLQAIFYRMTHNGSGPLGRSVAMLSFFVTSLVHGEGPWGFKFDNLLLHLGIGLLVFRLLYVILPALEPRLDPGRRLLIAGICAAVWLLHPLLVSTVLYVVQRMTQLAVLFSLAAMLAYLAARSRSGSGIAYWVYGWLLFPLCLVLALLSKEIAVLIPVYLLAFEWLVFRTTAADLRRNAWLRLWLGVFVAAPLVLGTVYFLTHMPQMADYSSRTWTMGDRLLTEVHVLFFYVRLVLLPRISDLSLFHDDFPVTTVADPLTLLLGALLLLVVGAIWVLRTRLPVLAFGLAWFLVSHLLESTFLPLELVFEHRNYLAAVGLILPVVHYLLLPGKRGLQLCVGAYAALLMFMTWNRTQEWGNEELFLKVAVAEHPQSPRARVSLANYLFNRGYGAEGLEHLRAAAQTDPRDAGLSMHMLTWSCVEGLRDEALLRRSEEQLRTWPLTVYGANVMQNLLTQAARKTCTVLTVAEIGRLIEAAVSLPKNQANRETYGFLMRFRGIHAFLENRYVDGVFAFGDAYNSTGQVTVLGELAISQIRFRRLDDAAATLALMETLNRDHYGAETYLITDLQQRLAAARAGAPPDGDAVAP